MSTQLFISELRKFLIYKKSESMTVAMQWEDRRESNDLHDAMETGIHKVLKCTNKQNLINM